VRSQSFGMERDDKAGTKRLLEGEGFSELVVSDRGFWAVGASVASERARLTGSDAGIALIRV